MRTKLDHPDLADGSDLYISRSKLAWANAMSNGFRRMGARPSAYGRHEQNLVIFFQGL